MRKGIISRIAAPLLAASFAFPAAAGNVANCEVLFMQVIADKDMNGEAQVATYGPAIQYISSVYDDEDGHITEVAGQPIRALMCSRNDVLPTKTDYALMATGIPFILSQDFDSSETDSLTIYWKEDAFKYVYKGRSLSDEVQSKLEDRLADFSERGLNLNPEDETSEPEDGNETQEAIDADSTELEDLSETDESAENSTETETEIDLDVEQHDEADIKAEEKSHGPTDAEIDADIRDETNIETSPETEVETKVETEADVEKNSEDTSETLTDNMSDIDTEPKAEIEK